MSQLGGLNGWEFPCCATTLSPLLKIPHHAPDRQFGGVTCGPILGRDLTCIQNQKKELRNWGVGHISCFKENHFGGSNIGIPLWQESWEFLKLLPARSYFRMQLWQEPIQKDLKIWNLDFFSNNLVPEPTPQTNYFWNQFLELFHKPQTTNHKPATIHPHCKILHSATKMPPVPTPLLSSSSPSPHEWTHRPILNFPPEHDQDFLHQLLLALWLFDTRFVSKFQCCPWTLWKIA